jgi:predicted DNA-binding protein YlxM (UPF0122 family)
MKRIHVNLSQETLDARTSYRDKIDLLHSRASLLAGRDKLLMTMYLENGNSFRQMAQLAGVSEANISRRIHRLIKRLMDGEYITCIRNREKFTETEMIIAKDYFLMGLSIKKIAAKQQLSYYCVRETLKKIRGELTRKTPG